MNPYEEPRSQPERPIENRERTAIRWPAIVEASLIYFVTTAILFTALDARYRISTTVTLVCIFAPWVLGAVFLSLRVRHRWVLHGMIYSAVPPLGSILFFLVFTGFSIILPLLIAPIGLSVSIPLTLASMSIVRPFVRSQVEV
jgi:hypothetical protein